MTATRSELGARFDKAISVQGGLFTLKAKTAWAHDWNTDRAAIATFQTLPGATFTVNGARPSADAALVSLGGQMGWHNGWSLAATVDGNSPAPPPAIPARAPSNTRGNKSFADAMSAIGTKRT